MRNIVENRRQAVFKNKNILENIALVLLAFYPLRHISWGLDLWDTGYNYANFQFMGTEHMDPMWLFSTYLATAVGHLLTKLPNGGTLMGMNLYTGLFASALGLAGYFFCTRGLKIPKWIAFVGEFMALSLCWCPTAVLYNYLSFLLFLGSIVLLYHGLTKEKRVCLIGAGVCLGCNVLVRFSNLPEAALIVVVWAYDVICWQEERQKDGGKIKGKQKESAVEGSRLWRRLSAHTGWCLLGYAAACAVWLGWIHLGYGLDAYTAGIARLFGMTDNATDYKPTAMIIGMVDTYVENLYWVVRIGVILACGLVLFALAGLVEGLCDSAAKKYGNLALKTGEKQEKSIGGVTRETSGGVPWAKVFRGVARVVPIAAKVLWVAVSAAMIWWLYARGFCSLWFYSYDAMLRPGVLFLMLTMLTGVIRILYRGSSREEKLISGILILVILLTSLGSNNKVYPSLNNLFVAAPYTLWESWRFVIYAKDKRLKHNLVVSSFALKSILVAFLAMCLFQFALFGFNFAFAEATGIQDVSARVEDNEILKNIGMSPEKAQWMIEISAFVKESGLQGKEAIFYGDIPALSYYLQMPAAFNPWSNLDSYSREAFAEALGEAEREVMIKGTPVIIMEREYMLYLDEGAAALEAAGVGEKRIQKLREDTKFPLLIEFMKKYNYQKVFDNGRFVIYQIE